MTQTITYNGTALANVVRDSLELTESAELGDVGTGSFLVHDSAGTVALVGHKTLTVDQDADTPSRLFTGYIAPKEYKRGTFTVGNGREIQVNVVDSNSLLARRVISGTDGKRPAETVGARLTWLLASDYLTGIVYDNGLVTYGTATLDKNDYRGQKPGDVLAACAKKAAYNYFVTDTNGTASLYFGDPNGGTALTSTLRISNVASDVDSTTTFAPSQDATLVENPDDVYSGVYATYSSGALYDTRAATGTAYVDRDGVTDDAGIESGGQAAAEATAFLSQSSSPEHHIEVAIRVRAAYVNLARAGDRIQAKFSHFTPEGYGGWTWFRITRRTITQPLDTDNDYDLRLTLSPQETPPVAASCSSLYANTPSATYYPLGGPPTGSIGNPSDGVVYYLRPGVTYPVTPEPGHQSIWHFPAYGAGGVGTKDFAGGCSQNRLRFMVVGNGTMTIQTEIYDAIGYFRVYAGDPDLTPTFIGNYFAGDVVVVTISDATAGDCIRIVDIMEIGAAVNCRGVGWSQMVWVAT